MGHARTCRYGHDPAGQFVAVTGPAGGTTSYRHVRAGDAIAATNWIHVPITHGLARRSLTNMRDEKSSPLEAWLLWRDTSATQRAIGALVIGLFVKLSWPLVDNLGPGLGIPLVIIIGFITGRLYYAAIKRDSSK